MIVCVNITSPNPTVGDANFNFKTTEAKATTIQTSSSTTTANAATALTYFRNMAAGRSSSTKKRVDKFKQDKREQQQQRKLEREREIACMHSVAQLRICYASLLLFFRVCAAVAAALRQCCSGALCVDCRYIGVGPQNKHLCQCQRERARERERERDSAKQSESFCRFTALPQIKHD